MANVPRMSWLARRALIRAGRRTGDPHTALRFLAVARLALGKSRRQVAADLDMAPSTVAEAARRFVASGEAGLLDGRQGNGLRDCRLAWRADQAPELCVELGGQWTADPSRLGEAAGQRDKLRMPDHF